MKNEMKGDELEDCAQALTFAWARRLRRLRLSSVPPSTQRRPAYFLLILRNEPGILPAHVIRAPVPAITTIQRRLLLLRFHLHFSHFLSRIKIVASYLHYTNKLQKCQALASDIVNSTARDFVNPSNNPRLVKKRNTDIPHFMYSVYFAKIRHKF